MRCGFSYGVCFPRKRTGRHRSVGRPAVEYIDVDTDRNADMLVVLPGEFDTSDEALVVIVNTRCLRGFRLIAELRHLTTSAPDSPRALAYVPERQPGDTYRATVLQQRVDRASLDVQVCSYYP